MSRSLSTIAREIASDWKKVYFGAVPYLQAMFSLNSLNDMYGADDARGIVLYFLSNATTWRGPVAKRIKLELKAMLAGKDTGLNECGCDLSGFSNIVDPDDQKLWNAIGIVGTESPIRAARVIAIYAKQAYLSNGVEGLRIHLNHLLEALEHWKGPKAAKIKKILKPYAEE